MISIIFAILVAIGVTGTLFAFLQHNYNLFFMLIPLGFWLFIVAPVVVWKKEREKVLEYERTDLEIVVANNGEYIHQRGSNWVFRVGIKTNGKISVNNIEVYVIKRNGLHHAYSDAPLRLAYSLPGSPSSFTIKPDDIRFVEVCSWGNGEREFKMHYHTSYQIVLKYYDEKYDNQYHVPPQMLPFLLSNGIPIGETITLIATGDNTKAVNKTLRIDTSGEKPSWKVVKNEQEEPTV